MSDAALLNTTQLLAQYRDGHEAARDALLARYLPILTRWAHGRLPAFSRDLSETDDLVQITFLRALNHLEAFESDRPGAFLAYLRTILLNLVRDELRRQAHRPALTTEADAVAAPQPSLVEQAVGRERLEAYERGLCKLPDLKRHAVIMRVEFDMSYEEIASELDRPSANAARMMVTRALDELAETMAHD